MQGGGRTATGEPKCKTVRWQRATAPGYNPAMPLIVFDTKGVPATRRERIEAAIEAGGRHTSAPYEAWIAAEPFRGGMRVLITGPQGFERVVQFAPDEQPAEITRRVRGTLDD
jgi:hypothetical protein